MGENNPVELDNVEWLKPINGVYVLTEDELENIKFQKYNKGYEAGKTYGLMPF